MSGRNWSPQITRAMEEFRAAAPPPPAVNDVRGHRPAAPRRRLVVPIAAALVVAGFAGTVAVIRRDAPAPAGGSAASVQHARYEVSWEAQLDCDMPIDNTATFDSVVIDTWSDRAGRRWRNQVTYPDGSIHDVILQGSAVYPTAQYERGERLDSTLGCQAPSGEPFILVAGPTLFFTLTLAPELRADERPYVRLYDDDGTLVDPDAVDSKGRASRKWEHRVTGTAGYGNVANRALTQVTAWWVDALDDTTVTERIYTNTVDTMGTATQIETLVVDETISVGDELFATDGYRAVGTPPRPEEPIGGPESTVTG